MLLNIYDNDHHDISDPPADLINNDGHEINDSLSDVDLKSIKLPPKIRKRGRLKGASLTVIGLPQKKKCIKIFKEIYREKQIFSWMLPSHLVTKALQSEVLEHKELICNSLEFSPDENVN